MVGAKGLNLRPSVPNLPAPPRRELLSPSGVSHVAAVCLLGRRRPASTAPKSSPSWSDVTWRQIYANTQLSRGAALDRLLDAEFVWAGVRQPSSVLAITPRA